MIQLLLLLLILLLVWFVVRRIFDAGAHPPMVPIAIDVIAVLIAIVLIARFAGLL